MMPVSFNCLALAKRRRILAHGLSVLSFLLLAAASNSEARADDARKVGDASVTEVKVAGDKLLPCTCWDSTGKTFYCLENNGTLRRFATDGLKEEKSAALTRKCSWLSLSAKGLLVTLPTNQEVWLVDPKTLEVKTKFKVNSVQRAASVPALSVGFAYGPHDKLAVLDLESGKVVKEYRPKDFENKAAFFYPAITADGKLMFTRGGGGQLHRFKIDGKTLKLDQSGHAIVNGKDGWGVCLSPDGSYVCMPSYGGNSTDAPPKDHPKAPSYSIYIYEGKDISRPACYITSGPSPYIVAFDTKRKKIYSHNNVNQLVVFDEGGSKEKDYQLEKANVNVQQILVHPDGGKVLVLTQKKMYWAALPAK
jgi:hypothetical protein